MDERRFEELKRKRFPAGLSDAEADELGRLFAEEAGREHGTASGRPHYEASPDAWRAEDEGDRVKAAVEDEGDPAEARTAADGPDDRRGTGTERQPVGPAGSGYAPPQGGREAPS